MAANPPAPGRAPAVSPQASPTVTAPLGRRLASLLYEGILLFGVAWITAYLFSALLQYKTSSSPLLTALFQAYMFIIIGLYFTWCWTHGGQTLPMKTWSFRLEAASGRLGTPRAWLRYALIWIGPVAGAVAYKLLVEATGFGSGRFSVAAFCACMPVVLLNWLWAYVDRERRFLHDCLAGTRLVLVAGKS
jgi:hypothetical protein